jgi:hypothetical protein
MQSHWYADPAFANPEPRKRAAESDIVKYPYQHSGDYYCSNTFHSHPLAYYHRAVRVKGIFVQTDRTNLWKEFLQELLDPECWTYFQKFGCKDEDPENEFKAKWNALDNAFVNFTHFARQKATAHEIGFTKFGIFHAWRRHAAYFMGAQFPGIDLLIPIAYKTSDDTITPESMSYILMSVKNHYGKKHDSIRKDYLNEELVLGSPNAEGQYLKPNNKSTLLLSLRTLPFILRKRDNSHTDDWIEVKESNPYIAFVMSLGSGDMEGVKRFVPELQVFKASNGTDN